MSSEQISQSPIEDSEKKEYLNKIGPALEYLNDHYKFSIENQDEDQLVSLEDQEKNTDNVKLAISELENGNPEKAREVLQKILKNFEELVEDPFRKWNSDFVPTDPEKIEEQGKKVEKWITEVKEALECLN